MIEFDIRTLAFVATLIGAMMTGAMLLVMRIDPDSRSTKYWALGNGLIALGCLMIGLRGHLPQFLSVPAANAALVAGYGSLLAGIARFVGRPVPVVSIVTLVSGVFVSFLYFTYAEPHISIRIVAISAAIAGLSLWAAWMLLADRQPEMRLLYRVMAGIYGLHAAYLAARILLTLTEAPVTDFMSADTVHALAFLDIIISSICLTFGFAAMKNRRLQVTLSQMARIDSLTGALNRRALEEEAVSEMGRSLRFDRPLSVMILDIDHFKRINDTFGHAAGDEVLRRVVGVVGGSLRQHDTLGRIGGEEFCVLLPETSRDKAAQVAERLRDDIAGLTWAIGGGRLSVTVSVGVSTVTKGATEEWQAITRSADAALYRAKHGGRNRVEVDDGTAHSLFSGSLVISHAS